MESIEARSRASIASLALLGLVLALLAVFGGLFVVAGVYGLWEAVTGGIHGFTPEDTRFVAALKSLAVCGTGMFHLLLSGGCSRAIGWARKGRVLIGDSSVTVTDRRGTSREIRFAALDVLYNLDLPASSLAYLVAGRQRLRLPPFLPDPEGLIGAIASRAGLVPARRWVVVEIYRRGGEAGLAVPGRK